MNWIEEQKNSLHHKLAIYLFPVVIFLAYIHPAFYVIGLAAFCLITSFKLLKRMLFFMIVLGGIAFALPFLAPIIFVVMIVFFVLRIKYVITNWKPFLAGIIIYGFSGFLCQRSFSLYMNNLVMGHPIIRFHFFEAVVVSLIGFIFMRATLIFLYNNGYSSYAALGIMGSVPIIIISFILPFLKLHIGGDAFSADAPVHTGVGHSGDFHDFSTNAHNTGDPGTHSTHSYYRTAPDGDPTNNLSYNGPNPSPVNPNLVHVNGYTATNPDGDPTNNFSYHGTGIHQGPQFYTSNEEVASAIDLHHTQTTSHNVTINNDFVESSLTGQAAVDRLVKDLKNLEKEKENHDL